MTYLVLPTHIKIIQNNNVCVLVEAVDNIVAKIDILQPVGFDEWLDVSDAIRKSLYLLQLDSVKSQISSTPHGY